MATFCRECDNVVEETRKRNPAYWLCIKHKRIEGQGFVDPDYWTNEEPFLRCKDVNGGACLLYTKRRENEQIAADGKDRKRKDTTHEHQ